MTAKKFKRNLVGAAAQVANRDINRESGINKFYTINYLPFESYIVDTIMGTETLVGSNF